MCGLGTASAAACICTTAGDAVVDVERLETRHHVGSAGAAGSCAARALLRRVVRSLHSMLRDGGAPPSFTCMLRAHWHRLRLAGRLLGRPLFQLQLQLQLHQAEAAAAVKRAAGAARVGWQTWRHRATRTRRLRRCDCCRWHGQCDGRGCKGRSGGQLSGCAVRGCAAIADAHSELDGRRPLVRCSSWHRALQLLQQHFDQRIDRGHVAQAQRTQLWRKCASHVCQRGCECVRIDVRHRGRPGRQRLRQWRMRGQRQRQVCEQARSRARKCRVSGAT